MVIHSIWCCEVFQLNSHKIHCLLSTRPTKIGKTVTVEIPPPKEGGDPIHSNVPYPLLAQSGFLHGSFT